MDFLILAIAATVGLYINSSFGISNMILGFIPSSFGGLSGAATGTAASPLMSALASGVVVAGAIAAAGHLHGRIGRDVRASV